MAIEISKERTAVFPYQLGDNTLHAVIGMMQGRHLKYVREHFPLKDENGEVKEDANGMVQIDWNAAGEHYYQTFFHGFEEEITIGGVVINSHSPEGKRQIEANMPAGFGGWVLQQAKKTSVFYESEKKAREGLPPGPDGPTE